MCRRPIARHVFLAPRCFGKLTRMPSPSQLASELAALTYDPAPFYDYVEGLKPEELQVIKHGCSLLTHRIDEVLHNQPSTG